jgi:hypothetical protein
MELEGYYIKKITWHRPVRAKERNMNDKRNRNDKLVVTLKYLCQDGI